VHVDQLATAVSVSITKPFRPLPALVVVRLVAVRTLLVMFVSLVMTSRTENQGFAGLAVTESAASGPVARTGR
jgi:hypothetical protein